MTEERDITDPDPDQQDPESGPASEEEGGASEESTGDAGLDRQVESLKHHGDKVAEDIEQAKGDWEAKQGDSRVPGAVPEEEPAQAAQSERGESPADAGQ